MTPNSISCRLAVLAAGLLYATPSLAQERPPVDSLQATLADFFRDVEAEDWDAAAARLDSAALTEWHAGVIEELKPSGHMPTVGGLMAANPGMSRGVAEHAIAEMRASPERQVQSGFAGVESPEELARLGSREAAARALATAAPEHVMAFVHRPPPGREPQEPGRVAVRRRVVLGAVLEAPDLGHVVYLDRWMDPLEPDAPPDLTDTRTRLRVATLRRSEGEWTILPEDPLSRLGPLLVQIWGGRPPGAETTEPPADFPDPAVPPDAVAGELFEALADHRWDETASLFEPTALEHWHRQTVRRVELHRRPPVEEMLAGRPDLPREVAEYRAGLPTADPMDFLDPPIAGVETLEELRALSPREAAARALQGDEPGYRHAALLAEYGERMPPEEAEALRAVEVPDWSRKVLGVVRGPAGGDAQVVYRLRWGGDSPHAIETLGVLSLVATDEGWRARTAGDGLLAEESRGPGWPAIMLRTGHATTPREEAPETVPPVKESLEEDRPPGGPEEIAERFVDAMNAADWDTVAALLDPVAVAWWHYDNVQSIEAVTSGEDPPGVRIRLRDEDILDQYGVESVAEMRHLPPAALAVRQLEWRHQARLGVPGWTDRFPRVRLQVDRRSARIVSLEQKLIGVVEDSEGFAYALYLDPILEHGVSHRPVSILVLRETDEGWRVMAEKLLMGTFRPFPLDEMPPSSGPE